MQNENGNISIHTENIFPIIKKWLYSDRDIFIRELISNGCDAINKLKGLSNIGEASINENTTFRVDVVFDNEKKTLKFSDNGIGMTDEEVKKYINQVAFSGAEDFISKYKDKLDEQNQIIGHFGLGFYSAFMVSSKVEIDTLSFKEGAEAVKWECDGGTEYSISPSERTERGTTITLYLNEDSYDFADEFKLREVITKYCSFLPFEIYLEDANPKVADSSDKSSDEDKDKEPEAPKPLNDIHPLWLKNPKECTDEEYKEFYHKVFHDFNDPLFWVHLHVDYPFDLNGILYFPKIKNEFETIEGQIKLYNNQVYVADNIKEVIPEFLMLLKGTIDSRDLPLNVSRSFLQNDRNVVKLSKHITKKVADKLTELFKNERENFNKFWDDINPFIKYGCLKEDDFYTKVKDILIFKTTNNEYVTLKEYLEKNKEKHENKVFYVSDEKQQAQYINMFKEYELEALILDSTIDKPFVNFLEMKESGVTFNRIDSDLSDTLKDKSADTESEEDKKKFSEKLEGLFKTALSNDKLKVQIEALKSNVTPAMILLSEQSRRMQEMSFLYGGGKDMQDLFPADQTLVLNKNNELIKAVISLSDKEEAKEDVSLICQQIYDLAMLSHKQLDTSSMTKFIDRSNKVLAILANMKSK